MGKVRFPRSLGRVLLVLSVGAFGLVAASTGAGATHPPALQPVVPKANYTCTSGTNLVTSWGYNNPNATTVNLTDKRNGGDHDSDDNFFTPNPGDRGQLTAFAPGVHDNVFSLTYPGSTTLKWTLQTSSTATAGPGPANCPTDLAITIAALPSGDLTAGFASQYTLTAKNNGPNEAAGVTVTDALGLPAGTTFPTASTTQGTCTSAAPNVNCSIGVLASGASATIAMSITPAAAGTLSHNATISSPTVADTNPSNNNATLSQTVGVQGGASGGGIINAGQSLTVADAAVNGKVTVQNGTVPLSASVGPCPVVPTITCKSEALNVQPQGVANGQILTAVFDTGKPSPFILIPFVKFFYFKDDLIDHPLPLCPRYLVPKPPADGSPCEYFRWMNLQGHAIVYMAFGAQDPRGHR